jgi:SAM-dependent methyltransferase
VTEPDRERLRVTFGEDAARYDRCRPGYPPELFHDLARLVGAGWPARALEIGPGTGQATVPLAELGYSIVAVELSVDKAVIARERVAAFPAVEVVVSAFEDWPIPQEGFDLVLCATAFHWLDPGIRMTKAADALRLGDRWRWCRPRRGPGLLRTLRPRHITGPAPFAVLQHPAGGRRVRPIGAFRPGAVPPVWEQSYSSREYVDVLLTYSGHRALPAARRNCLLTCVADLIDNGYGGRITKRYLTQLAIARVVA